MARQLSPTTFVLSAVVLAVWFPVLYAVNVFFGSGRNIAPDLLNLAKLPFLGAPWIPLWIITMGFMPGMILARGLMERLALFVGYFILAGLGTLIFSRYLTLHFGAAPFDYVSALRGRLIGSGSTFLFATALGYILHWLDPMDASRLPVLKAFMKSIWLPALVLVLVILATIWGLYAGGGIGMALIFLPLMGFVGGYGVSTFFVIAGAAVVARYGQTRWLVWFACASAVMMILPKLNSLVFPEGKLIVLSVLIGWLLIIWFCTTFLRSLRNSSEVYA